MNEKEQQLTEKDLKLTITQCYSVWAKNAYYSAVEAPIIFNFYSGDDTTLFIYKDNKKKIYKLMGNGFLRSRYYMPIEYGKDWDCLYSSTGYDDVRRAFNRAVKYDLEERYFGDTLNELR